MESKKIRNTCIVLLFIILFVYLVIFVNSIMNGNKVGFFSYRFYIMSTDSTESDTNVGDLIIAKNVKAKDIKVNDSIIFKKNDSMVIKKVIGTDENDGNTNIYIENDSVIFNENIQNAQIYGKVVHIVKGLGNVARFIQSPLGSINILLIVLCIFIIIKKISANMKSEDVETNENKESEKNENDNHEELL